MRTLQLSLSALLFASYGFAAPALQPVMQQYCFQCHGKAAMGGLSLEKLSAGASLGEHFQEWEKVAAALEQKRMPPAKMPQPTEAERQQTIHWIRANLKEYAAKHAGDPGRVTVRRLTSAEYGYTVKDLTGLDIKVDGDFVADSVGGEGFTNFGDVQFMQDAYLERYLASAKTIADHAVIGSGPIEFFADAGKSGFEISAITRIQEIYAKHGFRATSGEGGKPYGLDHYSKSFYACWRYQHRVKLGEPKMTLEQMAVREGQSPRLVRHLWNVLNQPSPSYPTSVVVSKYKSLPAPIDRTPKSLAAGEVGGVEVQAALVGWMRWLFAAGEAAAGGAGDERALVLSEESLQVKAKHKFRFVTRTRKQKSFTVFVSAASVNPVSKDRPVVLWRNGSVRVRKEKGFGTAETLVSLLSEDTLKKLSVNGPDFQVSGDAPVALDIVLPEEAIGIELTLEAEIGEQEHGDAVVRALLSDSAEAAKGRPISMLLGNSKSPGFVEWKAKVLDFGANLPSNSQGEATPADKDPIPAPWNNVYNQPERDLFHQTVKYYRTDKFLSEKILDDATRARLEQAWSDLYAAFAYHDAFLRFLVTKYKLNLKSPKMGDLTMAEIEAMPADARRYVAPLKVEWDAAQKAQLSAQPGHVEDCLRFASLAWRRPLTAPEKDRLRAFYVKSRETSKLDHDKAVRAVLARILIAPSFLYRLEDTAVSGYALANRLSYFIWASMPDAELRRAASAGELNDPQQLAKQTKRMLADPKARRMSAELFGQWLGFYRFDQYKGVDTSRFPEFTDELKASMFDESVSFFEHIIRQDRPVKEMLSADYAFLNQPLAKHYGVKKEVKSADAVEKVDGAKDFQRGGLLRLGSVLTVTSAPLRTSPVKRGDWVLRRILGTPTPPPPADAGSIPADDKAFGGLSLKEKLASHQRNATCAACHARIDPMGFPLERYDPIGRWRDVYADGKAVQDSSTTLDGRDVTGVDGLSDYLKSQEAQVLKTFSQKLLGYALGRTMLASDQPLIDKLVTAGGEARFSSLISEIVASRQFRQRREEREESGH